MSKASDRRADLKAKLMKRLHNPVQLRVFVSAVLLLAGYLAIYMPLHDQITETTGKLKQQRTLLELGQSIEHLRAQFAQLKDRLPQQTDSKEWVHYVLDGIRRFPLRMSTFDCGAPMDMGPYKVCVLRMELEGEFADLDRFLRWLEADQRLFRADEVKIAPARGGRSTLVMRLTVLGVMG